MLDVTGVSWPLAVSLFISICCLIYLWELRRSYQKRARIDLDGVEAFTSGGSSSGGTEVRVDDRCYDCFYSKVYDALVQPTARAGMETQVALDWMEKGGDGRPARSKETLRVADIGCATGLHVELFSRQGVHSVTGYDKSADMIEEARRRFPERDFRTGDVTNALLDGKAAADAFDLVTMFYFTIYTLPDRAQALKNIYLWLAPGGVFVVHVVNKLKFDPVLEAASPFVGFSVQKYADERVTKSAVAFEEFDYEGDFQLHGSRGAYEEVFRFKDGRTRKHEQRVWMPNIDALVGEITAVGFKYAHHVDMTAIGYEYNYLFFFQK